ncbi:MAG: phosphate ABC transporter permease PstA [Geodermatophilaceae bacterium]|nr:phosphate ABC transporter permease PstA [Geodermatophilaceae bacterium]
MATSLTKPPGSLSGVDLDSVPAVYHPLPTWVGRGLVATSAAVGVVLAVLGLNLGLAVLLAVVLLAVSMYIVSRKIEGARRAVDRLVTVIVSSAFALAMLPLVSLVYTVVSTGLTRIDLKLFTSDMRGVIGPGGGILHALVGTLLITAVAALMSIPIGLMAAVYLVEYGGKSRLAKAVTFLVDVMTGIPSIVAGLFAYALFVLFLGPGVRMGFAGSVALSVLMIPVVVRACEEMLRLVPNELREAAYALGVPKGTTIVRIVLPTAIAGIATGITLAVARVIGETAPLLIVAGFTSSTNWNLFDGRMMTLPVFAYSQYTQPGFPPEEGQDRAWAAALVLIFLVMALNLAARLASRIFAPKIGRR